MDYLGLKGSIQKMNGFMCMALNISKPPVLCKYSIAILLRLISRRGHYSVQPKKEKKTKKERESI